MEHRHDLEGPIPEYRVSLRRANAHDHGWAAIPITVDDNPAHTVS